jgi:hypothetical protein
MISETLGFTEAYIESNCSDILLVFLHVQLLIDKGFH